MTSHILEIPWDTTGTIIARPNRFLCLVDIELADGKQLVNTPVHVHDPGRLKEILYPGNKVRLQYSNNPNRKTQWDIIAGRLRRKWILINTKYHRPISERLLQHFGDLFHPDIQDIKPEVKIHHSRLDFVIFDSKGKRIGVEVKGCTPVKDGLALFPDAPTERGVRHLETLIEMQESGEKALLIILIFGPNPLQFSPNYETDPKFSATFWRAIDSGVQVNPIALSFQGDKIRYLYPVKLQEKNVSKLKK